jgi:hypothetical protein
LEEVYSTRGGAGKNHPEEGNDNAESERDEWSVRWGVCETGDGCRGLFWAKEKWCVQRPVLVKTKEWVGGEEGSRQEEEAQALAEFGQEQGFGPGR